MGLVVQALNVQRSINEESLKSLETLKEMIDVCNDDNDMCIEFLQGISMDNDQRMKELNRRIIGLQIGFGITLLTLIGLVIYSL